MKYRALPEIPDDIADAIRLPPKEVDRELHRVRRHYTDENLEEDINYARSHV